MHRFTLQVAMLLTLLTLPPAVLANASHITYSILNSPELQNGWTLSGTITTDGTIGQIQGSNILSWTWTWITSGAVIIHCFILRPRCDSNIWRDHSDTDGPPRSLLRGWNRLTTQGADLEWVTIGGKQLSAYAEVTSAPRGDNGWDSLIGPPKDGSSAWLIASNAVAVPEPRRYSSRGLVPYAAALLLGTKTQRSTPRRPTLRDRPQEHIPSSRYSAEPVPAHPRARPDQS